MAPETPNTKFLRDIKGPSSDYGGSDIDDALFEAEAASQQTPSHTRTHNIDVDIDITHDDTDYGSDFGSEADEEIARLLAEVDAVHVVTEPLIEPLEEVVENGSGRKCLVFVPNAVAGRSSQVGGGTGSGSGGTRATSYHTARESVPGVEERVGDDEVLADAAVARQAEDESTGDVTKLFPPPEPEPEMQPAGAEEEVEVDLTNGQARKPRKPEKPDIRTPIERFRRPPKKPLSVTDIVSPAWCELQYLYSLTKFGRVKRTPAMKQGSKVHKELESQVHTYVEIEVKTREDTFGLRIWNIIQGLRTLRATGLTRELETWGVLDGEVVNGIIDELSFECPDPELEASIELARESDNLPPGQTTISDFYASQQNPHSAWLGNPHPTRKVYLSDIKTRGTRYMPKGAALRGTQMQLMLYHRLLSDLASNMVHADTVFARYNLNAHTPFSPSFIGAIASLDDNFIHTTAVDDSEVEFNTLEDQFSELAAHNSLTLLWSLMITEFALILPTPNLSLSPILQAEFRASATGKVIGSHTFVYDSRVLERYVGKTMDWWMGRREARGVDIEEAFKCGVCEFAPGCEWRESKVEEGVRRFREKKRVGGRKWVV